MRQIRPRMFHGWWVVLICAFGVLLGPIPIVVLSFGVFLKPLAQEFHSGRAAVSLAFTLHNAGTAVGLPFAGQLVDRFGARKVVIPGTVLVGLILLFNDLLFSGRIWQLYIFYSALGVVACAAGPVPYVYVISKWFDRYRGLALGLMMFGLGFGALITPSIAQHLISTFGWHFTFSVAGATMLLFVVPMLAAFLRETPARVGLLPDGDRRTATVPTAHGHLGASWREAWRTRTFWLLLCSFVLMSASVHACFTHMAPIFADRGTPAQAAALASSLFGGGLLLGRTASGYLLDRFFAPRIAALIFSGAAAGIALLWIASSQELAFSAAFLVGIGLGAEGDIMPYLTSRYFGLRSFGEIYGFTFAGFVLAGGLGAYLMGAAFDAKGSYAWPLASFSIVASAGAVLMMRLGPYPYQIGLPVESGTKLEVLPSEP